MADISQITVDGVTYDIKDLIARAVADSKTTVTVGSALSSGTQIATITVDGTPYIIYAPAPSQSIDLGELYDQLGGWQSNIQEIIYTIYGYDRTAFSSLSVEEALSILADIGAYYPDIQVSLGSGTPIATISDGYTTTTLYAPTPPSPYTSNPVMDGTASPGSSANYARGDHKHPTDTSRQATLVSGTNIKTVNGMSLLGSGGITIPTGIALDELYDSLDSNVQTILAVDYGWADKTTFISQDEPTVFGALANIGATYPTGTGSGTVTSVGITNGGGLTITGSPITTSGNITVGHSNSVTAKTTQAVYPIKFDSNGHITGSGTAVTIPTNTSDLTNDSGFITGISSSDVTTALGYTPYNSTNPNGYTSNAGTVTSVRVQATSPVRSSTSTAQTGTLNTTISLANNYGDTKNPYASKTKNYVLAAPATANGTPSFRALVAADIPSLGYLPLSGGTMTGQILTSFKSSVAMGSYGASATTIPNLANELRFSSGCTGSVNIGTAYTKGSVTIPTGWYNFFFSPHRSGGVNGSASGDNCNYGTILLSGMTVSGLYRIRVQGSSDYVAELEKVYTSSTPYITSQGTSGNWRYRVWSNNFQEVWFRGTVTYTSASSSYQGWYRSIQNITIPISSMTGMTAFADDAATFASGAHNGHIHTCAGVRTNGTQFEAQTLGMNAIAANTVTTGWSVYIAGYKR